MLVEVGGTVAVFVGVAAGLLVAVAVFVGTNAGVAVDTGVAVNGRSAVHPTATMMSASASTIAFFILVSPLSRLACEQLSLVVRPADIA